MNHILLYLSVFLSFSSLWLSSLLSFVLRSVNSVLSEREGFMASWPMILDQASVLSSFLLKKKKSLWSLSLSTLINSVCSSMSELLLQLSSSTFLLCPRFKCLENQNLNELQGMIVVAPNFLSLNICWMFYKYVLNLMFNQTFCSCSSCLFCFLRNRKTGSSQNSTKPQYRGLIQQ